jgi:hypothetical protein
LIDIPIHESREDRYGKTERKHVTLTVEAIEAMNAYADRHGLFFSVAVETLALMGLGNTTAETLPRLVANMIEQVFNKQFNRFAKLLTYAAIASEEANYKSDLLILQTIWREAQVDPDNFIANMRVSDDPKVLLDASVRQIRDEIGVDAHNYAVARLQRPLSEVITILTEEVADAADEEE